MSAVRAAQKFGCVLGFVKLSVLSHTAENAPITPPFHPVHNILNSGGNYMSFFKKIIARLNFRSKIVFSYTILIFFAVFIIGIYSYYSNISILKSKEKQSMDDVLNIASFDIRTSISSCNATLMSFITDKHMFNVIANGYNPARDGIRWNDMDELFIPRIHSIRDTYTYIDQFTLYTMLDVPEIGDYLNHDDEVRDSLWYEKVSKRFNIYWEMDGDTLCISCPMQYLWNAQGSDRIGIIHITVDRDKFFKNLSINKNSKYIIAVRDANGALVYTNSDAEKELFDTENREVYSSGRKYISRTLHIDESDWDISIFLPESSLRDGAGSILGMTLLICVLCLILLTVINYFLSKKTTARIDALYADMQSIRNGNLDISISSKDTDEIGYIINGFGETLEKLKEAMDSVYEKDMLVHKNNLKILQAQINPHFLYNILSTISFQAMNADDEETAHTVDLLSTFYRTGLNRGDLFIDFSQELENVKAYVNMQLIMHGNSFDVTYDTDERLNLCRCINFIIQPIVENAITHGTDNLETGRGEIEIRSLLTSENNIQITVSDNGPEPAPGQLESVLKSDKSGYGIRNVNERIKISYGDIYGISFSRKNGRTVVQMVFPAKDGKPSEA